MPKINKEKTQQLKELLEDSETYITCNNCNKRLEPKFLMNYINLDCPECSESSIEIVVCHSKEDKKCELCKGEVTYYENKINPHEIKGYWECKECYHVKLDYY